MAKSPCATRKIYWVDYAVHRPPKIWGKQIIESTKSGYARFKPGVNRKRIDEGFYRQSRNGEFELNPSYVQIEECFSYYYDVGQIIGASSGKETQFVLIKWGTGGDVHGCPITKEELKTKYGVKNL